jgi:transcriptional regulator with XRE-family HTH domain
MQTPAGKRIIVDAMTTVDHWTGRETTALRAALRRSIRDFASHLGVGVRTVARWEAGGDHIRPRPDLQAVLDTALAQAPPDAKARFRRLLRDRVQAEEGPTNRRQLLAGGLGASGFAVLASTEAPLAQTDDDQLLMLLPATYRRLEQRLPARLLVAPVLAHLVLIRQLLAATTATDDRHRRLSGVLSETAGLAAWLYADLEERASARRHYQLAVRAAHQTGHPLLPAYMQASLGQFASWCGDAHQGLALIAQARSWLKAPPPLAVLWLDTLEAVALAECGDQRALTLLDRAEDRVDAVQQEEPVWPWIFHFDAPKLAGYRLLAAAKLGRTHSADLAYRCWSQANPSPKQRALMNVERARILATAGDLPQACAVAVAAFDAGRRTGSERVIQAVARFRAGLGSRAGSVTRELDDRLQATYEEEP